MVRLVTLALASLLVIPLIAELAAAADARAAGRDAPAGHVLVAGVVIAALFPLGGLMVLVRPFAAAGLFLLAGGIAIVVGYDDGWDGLMIYAALALLLAGACAVCARDQVLQNGEGAP